MPLQATSGAASQDAFGGNGVAVAPNYIEDVFSTYLYTGTAAALTITNNIDLSTKGGLVWMKKRGVGSGGHQLYDTVRGATKVLFTDATVNQLTYTNGLTAFGTTGFSIGSDSEINGSGDTQVSWSFAKATKFFDVVTYTGSGSSNRQISHAIGGTVGCVIVKRTDSTGDWMVYHQGSTNGNQFLNQANGGLGSNAYVNGVSSTTFTVSSVANTNAATYVAYVFAHNAGGFGLTGTENVITCGSYTGDGTNNGSKEINLGFEPQFLIVHGTGDWVMADNMRCMNYSGNNVWLLRANTTTAEGGSGDYFRPTATGFKIFSSNANANASGTNYIYIAIRRGPMKVPTTGTSVFAPNAWAGTGSPTIVPAGFPIDMVWIRNRSASGGIGGDGYDFDRLRGANCALVLNSTGAEDTSWGAGYDYLDNSTGFGVAAGAFFNNSGTNYIDWMFRRAPSFFDEVCYTGTLATLNVSHNLGVVPQLIITKSRSATGNWTVQPLSDGTKRLRLQTTAAETSDAGPWGNTNPTSSVFTLGADTATNASGVTYVAYLFATCAGVSKVGSYTGTATTKQIDCGFTAGARFVLIKRTDDVGDWYVWDSARGIIAGNDPYLLLNSTAAEVTSTDYIDTYSAGFEISSTAPAAINASGGSFIFLAIS